MKDEIAKRLHDIRGSFSVVRGFLRCLDEDQLGPGERELYSAAQLSLEKIEKNLEAIASTIAPSTPKL